MKRGLNYGHGYYHACMLFNSFDSLTVRIDYIAIARFFFMCMHKALPFQFRIIQISTRR